MTPRSPTVRHITTASVVVVAGVAAVVSYAHVAQLATNAGEGWRSWLIPISIDGLVVAASMVLLTRRRAGLPGSALAWGALAAGVLASLAANMADARPAVTAVLVAGWAPVAFAIGFELLLQQRRAERSTPATAPAPLVAQPTDGTGLAVPPQPARPVLPTTAAPTPIAPVVEGATMRTTSAPGLPLTGPVPLQDQSAPHPGAQRFDTVNAHRGGSTSKGNGQVTPVVASATPAVASASRQSRQPSPAPTGDLVDLVRPLVGEGLGRQAIATRLGITPHQARQAINAVNSERPALRAVATGGTR